jgi:hypothetical protein
LTLPTKALDKSLRVGVVSPFMRAYARKLERPVRRDAQERRHHC